MSAIIVAGGSGERMHASVPKQFLDLCGWPMLMHCVKAFVDACEGINIIVVLPSSQIEYWHKLCDIHGFMLSHQIVEGGSTRFHSVKNGLSVLPDEGLVAIHDGARPLVNRQTIVSSFRAAARYGCAIPAVSLFDSVRMVSHHSKSRPLNRFYLRVVQTPQVFKTGLIKKAYQQDFSHAFTDDATVFENAGNIIHLTTGNMENIKITNPHDLVVAEALLKQLRIESHTTHHHHHHHHHHHEQEHGHKHHEHDHDAKHNHNHNHNKHGHDHKHDHDHDNI